MLILANDIEKAQEMLNRAGPYVTLAVVSVAVFVLAYLVRAIENYIRHLHRKSYLPFASPRFVVATLGYILVADGFFIGFWFSDRLPLPTAAIMVSAGLVLLIASAAMSLVPYVRQIRQIREGGDEGADAADERAGQKEKRGSD